MKNASPEGMLLKSEGRHQSSGGQRKPPGAPYMVDVNEDTLQRYRIA